MQGFPISLVELMPQAPFEWELDSQSHMTELAGNMVTLPVMLAYLMSTLCGVSWQPVPCDGDTDGAADVAEMACDVRQAALGSELCQEQEGAADKPTKKRRVGCLTFILEPVD